jgi:hypothetical protein
LLADYRPWSLFDLARLKFNLQIVSYSRLPSYTEVLRSLYRETRVI